MADDKIILTEIDIDVDASVANISELKTKVADLSKALGEMKKDGKDTSAEYIKLSTDLKVTTAELKSNETMLVKVAQSNKANTGSLEEMRSKLAIVSKQWSALSEDERVNSEAGKKLSAQKLALSNAINEEQKATGNATGQIGFYERNMDGASETIGKFIPGAEKATKGVQLLGLAFKTALGPIGLIIAALGALYAYFTRSEEGQNKLTKAIAVFKSVLNTVMNIAEKAGKFLVTMFESPKEALKALGDLIKSQITNRLEALKGMGAAIIKIFSKDWKEGFKELGSNFVDFETGVKNTIGKVKGYFKELSDEVSKNAAIAARLADLQAALNKKIREEVIEDAKRSMEIAKLRAEAAQKDKYDGEERLKMLDKAIEIENEMMADELAIAKQKAYIHAENMKIGTRTKEDLDEQAQLEADVFNIEKENAEKRRGFQRQRQSAIKDQLEDLQKVAEASVNAFNDEVDRWKIMHFSKLKIAQENNKLLTQNDIDSEIERLTTIAELEEQSLKKTLDLKINEIDAKENESDEAKYAEKQKLIDDFNTTVLQKEVDKNMAIHDLNYSFEEQERQRKIDAAIMDNENNLAIYEGGLQGTLDAQLKANDLKRKEEIRAATKIGADVSLINKKYDKADRALSKANKDAKLALAGDFAQNIAQIAGEQSAIGKAAAAAATTISTFQGATAAFTGMVTSIPGPVGIGLGIAAAAAAVASGIANVKKIYATKTGLPGDGGGGGGGSTPSVPATTAPDAIVRESVNPEIGAGIVSRSTQVADNGGIVLQPTLVEDEVTNKQKNSSSIKTTSVL